MISWQVNDFFDYVPVSVNCLSAQGPACPINHLLITADVAAAIKSLCERAVGPIVFDFFGTAISDPRAFEVFRRANVARPVLFSNVNDYCLGRLKDDGVPLTEQSREDDADARAFWVGDHRESRIPVQLKELNGRFVRQLLMSKQTALTDYNDILPSTPVHATKYYDVKKLCAENNVLQIIAVEIAAAVLRAGIECDAVVASSNTGSLIAVPVSILLGKQLHCWIDLGPSFRPKRRMEWTDGKGKKCLLVADVICMGTEARAAQAFMAASGTQLVGCAAVAAYLPPKNLPCLSLLDRSDLERMDYRLSIPDIGEHK